MSKTFPVGSVAVVLGSSGGIGKAIRDNLAKQKIFYDVIYNPPKTSFLSAAEKNGHKIINGRDMFLYQAQKAFNICHNVEPEINKELVGFLKN